MPRKKQLTDEERAEIEEAFELFDSDKDKQLDRDEFKVALQEKMFRIPFFPEERSRELRQIFLIS